MFNKKIFFFILLLAGFAFAQENPKKENAAFQPTLESSRPWVYWYWMQSAYSKEGITADLEAMKQAGIGGPGTDQLTGSKYYLLTAVNKFH